MDKNTFLEIKNEYLVYKYALAVTPKIRRQYN